MISHPSCAHEYNYFDYRSFSDNTMELKRLMLTNERLNYRYLVPNEYMIPIHSSINNIDKNTLDRIRYDMSLQVAKKVLDNCSEELIYSHERHQHELIYTVYVLTDPEKTELSKNKQVNSELRTTILNNNRIISKQSSMIQGYEQNFNYLNSFWNRLKFLFTNKI